MRVLFALLAVVAGVAAEPVKVAVIGGMTMTGFWQHMSAGFEEETGIRVELVATGPKHVLDEAFRKGGVDFLTMHSSDAATRLVADGLAKGMRPWAFNEQVLLGPEEDPAGVRGMEEGAEAFRVIAAKRAPFVEARNVGSQTVCAHLWKLAKVRPFGDWLLKDGGAAGQLSVSYARGRSAYVVAGHIPVLAGKIPSEGMEVMVSGDPEMRRPYVLLLAEPERTGASGSEGAARLADWLCSDAGQRRIATHRYEKAGGKPVFFGIGR